MSEQIELEKVKNWLKRYSLLMQDIDSLILRADALRDRAASPQISVIDGMPHAGSGSSDRIGGLVALYEDLEAEARQKMAQAKEIYSEIDAVIRKIQGSGSAAKRVVLQMRYLDGFGWEAINEVLWLGKRDFLEKEDTYRRRTFKIHQTALIAVSEIVSKMAIQEMRLKTPEKGA